MTRRPLALPMLLGAALLLAGCESRPTRADLEGDWVSRSPGGSLIRAFSFRGDSALRIGVPGATWQPYSFRSGTLTIPGAAPPGEQTFTAAFSGDTLVLTPPGFSWRVPLVRLPVAPEIPRPERIAFSSYWCMETFSDVDACPAFDFEIDSTGTLHYERRRFRRDTSRFVSGGQRALYDRLSELAAASRADTARSGEDVLHDTWTALALWYGGRRQVHEGTRYQFGGLGLLISEIERAVGDVPLRPDPTPYRFETRSFAEPPALPPPPGG